MEKKHRFFIYERQELGILVLLGLMVAVFAFTLGVHLGKRVTVKPLVSSPAHQSVTPVGVETPAVVVEDPHHASAAAAEPDDDTLNQALHEEVTRTGIKIDQTRQVQLPEKTKEDISAAAAPASAEEHEVEDAKYALQVGSYADQKEAQDRAKDLGVSGLKVSIREAEIRGKGRWYRLFVGGYANKAEATKAGENYRTQGLIESFIVAKP